MIIKASQRGGARQLAVHLSNEIDNQHVELTDIRGFISDDLHGALLEAHSISKATRCKQFMFSICLSPPPTETVPAEVFEAALERIEVEFGLENQPRALVFHEKEARRHLHAVYSRIDIEEMKAINLPYFKSKLRDISREIFIEHDWKIPRGLMNSQERDFTNFTLQEYQQAKRARRDPKAIKAVFQESWNLADGAKAFKNALEERGYYLAKGDRRGFVAVDFTGEVYAVARWTGKRTKSVKEKLGDPKHLPSIEETNAFISQKMKPSIKRYVNECDKNFCLKSKALRLKRQQMTATHRKKREALDAAHKKREQHKNQQRMLRLRRGLAGLWDRFTGVYQKARKQNEREFEECRKRNRLERQKLITQQLEEQRHFQKFVSISRARHTTELTRLLRDTQQYKETTMEQEHENYFEYSI